MFNLILNADEIGMLREIINSNLPVTFQTVHVAYSLKTKVMEAKVTEAKPDQPAKETPT